MVKFISRSVILGALIAMVGCGGGGGDSSGDGGNQNVPASVTAGIAEIERVQPALDLMLGIMRSDEKFIYAGGVTASRVKSGTLDGINPPTHFTQTVATDGTITQKYSVGSGAQASPAGTLTITPSDSASYPGGTDFTLVFTGCYTIVPGFGIWGGAANRTDHYTLDPHGVLVAFGTTIKFGDGTTAALSQSQYPSIASVSLSDGSTVPFPPKDGTITFSFPDGKTGQATFGEVFNSSGLTTGTLTGTTTTYTFNFLKVKQATLVKNRLAANAGDRMLTPSQLTHAPQYMTLSLNNMIGHIGGGYQLSDGVTGTFTWGDQSVTTSSVGEISMTDSAGNSMDTTWFESGDVDLEYSKSGGQDQSFCQARFGDIATDGCHE